MGSHPVARAVVISPLESDWKNKKGCDIGYVLAVGSCEGVNDKEHAPSQPLMRPLLSQFQTPIAPRRAIGFFGSGCSASCLVGLITQLTLDWRLLGSQPFQPSTAANVIPRHCGVNARIRCNCGNSTASQSNDDPTRTFSNEGMFHLY